MRVLLTGGCGFVGQWLARMLLARGKLATAAGEAKIDELVLLDAVMPEFWLSDVREGTTVHIGDIAAADVFDQLGGNFDSVFHLAAIMSGQGEQDFDAVMHVNLDGLRNLLQRLRTQGNQPRLVLTSTLAVFGYVQQPTAAVGDFTAQMPTTTYGTTKAISELLVNDQTRKGYIDGRCARLNTIIVRAGKPNQAASSFCSGVLREPLVGVDSVLPVPRSQPMPVSGYRASVAGIIAVHELDGQRLGYDRAVGLPGLNITAGDLLDCCDRLRTRRPGMGKVHEKIDPQIATICAGWAHAVDNSRACELGLPPTGNLDDIVAEYINDYVDTN